MKLESNKNMKNDIILYHGSRQIVERPEIRIAKFKKPTHQISFHTKDALSTLTFLKGCEVSIEE